MRTRLRAKVKAAVRSEMPVPGLEERIRATIRERERRARTPWFSNRIMLFAAAMVTVCFAFLLVTQPYRGSLP